MNPDPPTDPQGFQVIDTERFIIESLAEIKTLLQGVASKAEDHEIRIRALEKAKWLIAGASAAGGAALGTISSQLFV